MAILPILVLVPSSRNHQHISHTQDRRGCFGMEIQVTTGSGQQKLMRDLRIGDEVLSDGTGRLTKFVGWMEYSSNAQSDILFINIYLINNRMPQILQRYHVGSRVDGPPQVTVASSFLIILLQKSSSPLQVPISNPLLSCSVPSQVSRCS